MPAAFAVGRCLSLPHGRVSPPRSPNRACGFPALGSPVGSCISHTEHPGGRSGRGSGTPILIAKAARLPPSVPRRVRWVVEPVYASTTPSLPRGACTRRLARPFTFACDASGISGPRFGVIGFATPVSLLPSVIPPHLRSLPSTGITPLPRYSEPLRHPASPRPLPAGSPVPCVHTPDRASRVAAAPLFHACRRHYPGGTVGAPVARFPTGASLPRVIAGSASASLFSKPARRSLSLPPACSLSRLATLFHRSASAQVVTSPSRSDCSRLERQLPDGVRTRWVTAPFHGARLRSANPTYFHIVHPGCSAGNTPADGSCGRLLHRSGPSHGDLPEVLDQRPQAVGHGHGHGH